MGATAARYPHQQQAADDHYSRRHHVHPDSKAGKRQATGADAESEHGSLRVHEVTYSFGLNANAVERRVDGGRGEDPRRLRRVSA